MRLRSTQFVFLILVLCSVQIRQECALQLMADAIAGRNHAPAQERKAAARRTGVTQANLTKVLAALALPAHPALSLAPQYLAAERAPWTMPHPASAFTAVASHTSLIRA